MSDLHDDYPEQWQKLVQTVNLPACVVGEGSRLVLVNDSFRKFTGLSPAEHNTESLYSSLCPWLQDLHLESDRKILQYDERDSFNGLVGSSLRPDHPVRFEKSKLTDVSGRQGVFLLLVDRLDYENKSKRLQRIVEYRDAFVNGFPGGIGLFNQQGEYLWGNKEIARFLDTAKPQRLISSFTPYTGRLNAQQVMKKALSGSEISSLQKLGSSGREQVFEITGIPVGEQGNLDAFMIFFEVTEKYELEKQLRHAQKMEAIGTLAGGIAHDFNNVLTPIMGYSEILRFRMRQQESVDQEADGYLNEILQASKRAKNLVEQILTFSRSSEQKESVQYLHPIVKEVMKLMRSTLPSTIRIEEDINVNCGMVVVDPVLFHQVLINLCTNSLQAIGANHGVISVTLRPAAARVDDKDWVELVVKDSGSGMDDMTRERIFEPYFTTREKEQGTGLGLAMVHGIIERQGGRINVESTLGVGTVFTVSLPVAVDKCTKVEQVVNAVEFKNGKGLQILLVDDDPQVVRVTGDILKSLGYAVTGKTSPNEALSAVRDVESGTFALVITDLTMPELDGLELAEKLKEIEPNLPVVILSGYSDILSKEETQKAGIAACCTKPISLRGLAKVVYEAIHQDNP